MMLKKGAPDSRYQAITQQETEQICHAEKGRENNEV